MSPFRIFLASFLLKYDVTDAIRKDIEKIKVQYLRSLLFDLFKILQAVRSKQKNSNFIVMTTKRGIITLRSKTKTLVFSHIRRAYYQFF